MEKGTWDHKRISKYVEKMQEKEIECVARLNSCVKFFLPDSYNFRQNVGPNGNSERWDCELYQTLKQRCGEHLVSRIEIENADKQIEWTNRLPRHLWRFGINLLARKDYSKFDYFLKVSSTLESCFCIRTSWFLKATGAEGRMWRRNLGNNHRLKEEVGNTCTEVWSIPWDVVDRHRSGSFQPDDRRGLVVCEGGDWEPLVRFIQRTLQWQQKHLS